MEYSKNDLYSQKTGGTFLELPTVCMPVYKDVIKEMSEVIKDVRVRDVFYSLLTGSDAQTVSRRTGIAPRNLAYMYKKGIRAVYSEWKSYSEWKRELDNACVRCRNYESLLPSPQDISRQNFRNVIIVVRDPDIPSEYLDLLVTPLGKLGINFRALRALRKYNIYLLEDLLRFIKYNGFDALRTIPGMGVKSAEQLYEILKDKNILEDKDTCVLFRYLFV